MKYRNILINLCIVVAVATAGYTAMNNVSLAETPEEKKLLDTLRIIPICIDGYMWTAFYQISDLRNVEQSFTVEGNTMLPEKCTEEKEEEKEQ